MISGIMKKFFGTGGKTSAQDAHDRLKFVLIHDRAHISQEVMEKIKNDIIRVISKYMEIDRNAMEISLENEENSVALVANIPVSRVKYARKRR